MLKFNFLFILIFIIQACQPNKESNISMKDNKNIVLKDHTPTERKNGTIIMDTIDSTMLKNNEVTISVIPNLFNKGAIEENAVYIMHNGTDYTINFGSPYKIERREAGKWIDVPFKKNILFTRAMKSLEAGESAEYRFELAYLFDKSSLLPGSYRLVKEIWKEKNKEDKAISSGEFSIATYDKMSTE